MATFLLAPGSVPALARQETVAEMPELEVSDYQFDHNIEDGSGLWIPVFLKFLEKKVRTLGRDPRFTFSSHERLCDHLLDEISSPYVRNLAIRFCNEQYEQWRDRDVDLPDYDDIHDDCRSYCDDCDSGWDTQYGEYEGPLPEDVEDDEDVDEPGIGEEERDARAERNRERQRERIRLERARDEAESEEVNREFICDDDCDGFCDCVYEAYRDAFPACDARLEERWREFLRKGRRGRFPPLHAWS